MAVAYPHPKSSAVSAAMRGNRRRDTRPEVALRSALHRLGLRFRADYFVPLRDARGIRVDIAFTRLQVAVMVDGCFWHGCPEHGHVPSRNPQYWPAKFARNAVRDRLVNERLEERGWHVLRIWEHLPIGEAVEVVTAAVKVRDGRS